MNILRMVGRVPNANEREQGITGLLLHCSGCGQIFQAKSNADVTAHWRFWHQGERN